MMMLILVGAALDVDDDVDDNVDDDVDDRGDDDAALDVDDTPQPHNAKDGHQAR
jgi:hypothetical protein